MSSSSKPTKSWRRPESPSISGSSEHAGAEDDVEPEGSLRPNRFVEAEEVVIPVDIRLFQEAVEQGSRSASIRLLETKFESLTQSESPFAWIKEPLAMGFTPEEVVDLVLEEKSQGPWIYYVPEPRDMPQLDVDFHHPDCLHHSINQDGRQLPRPLKSAPLRIKRMIAETCGLGGLVPHSTDDMNRHGSVNIIGSTAAISYGASDDTAMNVSVKIQKALSSCRLALDRVVGLCAWLQQNEYACNHLVVLTTGYFGRVVEARIIPFSLIAQLHDCVTEAQARDSENPDPRNNRMFETALQLLSGTQDSTSAGYLLENAVDVCALAVQMTCIGLLSASEAHVGPIHPLFLDRPITKFSLLGINGTFSKEFRLSVDATELACLGLMLGQPAMAVGQFYVEAKQTDPCFIRMPLGQILELWGPGRKVLPPHHMPPQHYVEAIEIGGGIIYRPHDLELWLHWRPGSFADRPSTCMFDTSNMLAVGCSFSVNDGCSSKSTHEKTVPRNSIRKEILELGTWREKWTLQQVQTGLQMGRYVGATFNATWIRSSARARKEKALAEVGTDFLEQHWGLLVSVCTGIARRVSLNEAIAGVISPIMETNIKNSQSWNRLERSGALEKMKGSGFRTWVRSLSPNDQVDFSRNIEFVVRRLCWTGVNDRGSLVVACPSTEDTHACIHIPLGDSQALAAILKDSPKSATFACLTNECIETDRNTCQGAPRPLWQDKVPALATSVCQYRYLGADNWEKLSSKGLEDGRLYWMGSANDKQRLIAKVDNRQGGVTRLSVSNSQVPWSFYSRAYERIKRMRPYYVELRERTYMGEDHAVDVLIQNE